MSWLKTIFLYLRSWFRDKRIKGEIDEELRFRVEMATEANLKSGMPREVARAKALRGFRRFEFIKEVCRDMRSVGLADNFVQDNRRLDDRSQEDGQWSMVNLTVVSPNYLSALNVPLLRGRSFTDQDCRGSEPVVLVKQSFVRRVFGKSVSGIASDQSGSNGCVALPVDRPCAY